MTKFAAPIGEPPAVQYFPPNRLAVDNSYQRTTRSHASKRLIEAIARKWDWRLCTPLLVASRNGGFYIIDGQHRWEAAKLRGDIPFLPCAVGQYDGAAAEAALFVAANQHRVAVNRLDIWRAAVAAGDADTLTIERLLESARLSVASNTHQSHLAPGELLCTKGLYRALRLHGEDKLAAALRYIGSAFEGQVISNSGVILAAVVAIVVAPPANYAPARFLDALSSSSAEEWGTHPALNGIKGGQVRAEALRRVIVELMDMLEVDEDQEDQAA
jgi:hypothetical protein